MGGRGERERVIGEKGSKERDQSVEKRDCSLGHLQELFGSYTEAGGIKNRHAWMEGWIQHRDQCVCVCVFVCGLVCINKIELNGLHLGCNTRCEQTYNICI